MSADFGKGLSSLENFEDGSKKKAKDDWEIIKKQGEE